MGQAPPGNSYNDDGGGFPLVAGAGDMKAGRVAPTKYTTAPTKLSRPDDVIIGIRASIGMRAQSSEVVCLGRGVAALRAGAELDPGYLWHWIEASASQLAAKGRGATFLQVSRQDIAEMEIPVPPLAEQRRIARLLNVADRVRDLRSTTFGVLEEARAALFASTVAASDGSWPLVPVAGLVDASNGGIRTGPFGSQLLHSEFVDEGVAVLGIDNAVANEFRWGAERHVTETKYAQLRRYTVHPGDVLITIMGTNGRVAVVPDEIGRAINTKHLCCITLNRSRCLPEFLHAYFLRHPIARHYLASRAKGAIMAGLNMTIIKELPVSLPPIDVQNELVDRLAAVDRAHDRADLHREHLDSLFKSLQQRAFAGALRRPCPTRP
jgi:type I restriction enzyme, S subunit